VFVMGGDGTVNEGISGLAEEEYRPKFGFFPLGTVNDLARALKMPLDPEEAIQSLDLTKTKALDIGKVNNKNYFMNVIAIGTIPQAVNETSVEEKTKLGK
ncbi:diacylglycerol/lipid kinase family protein, partial [Enterococcus faecium]|uniref:diacylglycerol/lipid kinase family protein n=1 Tax=Enterococcus faecium TaxID=1352 RepID=UPI0034E988D6